MNGCRFIVCLALLGSCSLAVAQDRVSASTLPDGSKVETRYFRAEKKIEKRVLAKDGKLKRILIYNTDDSARVLKGAFYTADGKLTSWQRFFYTPDGKTISEVRVFKPDGSLILKSVLVNGRRKVVDANGREMSPDEWKEYM